MIESITIKNIATFDNTGVVLNDLKKLNFFFGHNGSGKSTIAKFLRDVSVTDFENKNSDYQKCSQVGYNPTDDEIPTQIQVIKTTNGRSKIKIV